MNTFFYYLAHILYLYKEQRHNYTRNSSHIEHPPHNIIKIIEITIQTNNIIYYTSIN